MTKEELIGKKISAISLGCDKNKVDLEKMLGRLAEYGFEICPQIDDADIVIVNTCSFIQIAQEEAIANIIEMEHLKKMGRIEKLVVTGCFPERNFQELKANFPDVDACLKLNQNDKICSVIEELYGVTKQKKYREGERILTSQGAYAYLKIADGCNNACAYCTIPRIRGRYVSVPIGDLVDEAKNLASRGIKELILVAQDTTRYGEELYGENMLIPLCEKLSKIKGIERIRLHYAYPEKVTEELLKFICTNEKMCKYIDIPLQHIDGQILQSMRRRLGEDQTRDLIEKIKCDYPEIKVRSTFIVGYPGETGKKFKKLCQFIKEAELDYVGFFAFSKEPNTSAYYMKKQVPNFIKKWRLKKISKIQSQTVGQKARNLLEKDMEVFVDFFDEERGEFVGHSDFLSPTVDFGVRFVDNGNIKIGDKVKVKIFDFDGCDYKGVCL